MITEGTHVRLTIKDYEKLKSAQKALSEILQSEKAIELSGYYSYDIDCTEYIINPPPDFVSKLKYFDQEAKVKQERYWSIRNLKKRIMPWHLFRKISDLL